MDPAMEASADWPEVFQSKGAPSEGPYKGKVYGK